MTKSVFGDVMQILVFALTAVKRNVEDVPRGGGVNRVQNCVYPNARTVIGTVVNV